MRGPFDTYDCYQFVKHLIRLSESSTGAKKTVLNALPDDRDSAAEPRSAPIGCRPSYVRAYVHISPPSSIHGDATLTLFTTKIAMAAATRLISPLRVSTRSQLILRPALLSPRSQVCWGLPNRPFSNQGRCTFKVPYELRHT
jgi:hypothetical protein